MGVRVAKFVDLVPEILALVHGDDSEGFLNLNAAINRRHFPQSPGLLTTLSL